MGVCAVWRIDFGASNGLRFCLVHGEESGLFWWADGAVVDENAIWIARVVKWGERVDGSLMHIFHECFWINAGFV